MHINSISIGLFALYFTFIPYNMYLLKILIGLILFRLILFFLLLSSTQRFFVLDNGILKYSKSPVDVSFFWVLNGTLSASCEQCCSVNNDDELCRLVRETVSCDWLSALAVA